MSATFCVCTDGGCAHCTRPTAQTRLPTGDAASLRRDADRRKHAERRAQLAPLFASAQSVAAAAVLPPWVDARDPISVLAWALSEGVKLP